MCAKSLQSCPTLCDPMDCSPPGSSVHGILQARILERVVIPSSRGSSRPRDRTCVSCSSCIAGGFFTAEPPGKPNNNIIYLLLQLPVLPYILRAESDTSLCFEVIQLLLHLLSIYQMQGILRGTKNESGTRFCLPSIIRLIWKIHSSGVVGGERKCLIYQVLCKVPKIQIRRGHVS